MARKRMIDPSIWNSEDFSELSDFAQLIWIGLFSQADDEGRGKSKPAYLKSILFPYSEDMKLIKKVDNSLNEIAKVMSITFYKVDNNEYYQLENWGKWQKVEKAQISKIPPHNERSEIIRLPFGERSANVQRPVSPNRIEENKKRKEENINAGARECNLINNFSFEELLAVCERTSPVIWQRHKKQPNADYKLGQIYEEISTIMSLKDVEVLLKHTNKTYIVQPKYNTLDFIWVLNNKSSVMSSEEIKPQGQHIENNKQRNYD